MMHVASLLPKPLVGFEHVREMGTREPYWTRHQVGSRCADHGRKREPGDGHIRHRSNRTASGASKSCPETDNPRQPPRLANAVPSRPRRPLKSVLDPKRPITEEGWSFPGGLARRTPSLSRSWVRGNFLYPPHPRRPAGCRPSRPPPRWGEVDKCPLPSRPRRLNEWTAAAPGAESYANLYDLIGALPAKRVTINVY